METCNALDDDCDGEVDEDLEAACGLDVGACRPGARVCAAGEYGACQGAIGPTEELCNGLDDDCDGLVDDVAPLGGAAMSEPAWSAVDEPLAVAETLDGARQAVVFHAPGGNGEMSLTASTFDLGSRTVTATWSFFPTRSRRFPKVWFVGDTVWIAFIDRPGSDAAQLQILRYDVEGREVAAPVAVGADVDEFSVAVGDGAVGIARSQARGEAWISILDLVDGPLIDRHVTDGLPVALDPAVTVAARGEDWLVGSELRTRVESDHTFVQWLVAADGTVGPAIQTGLINGRRPTIVETPAGSGSCMPTGTSVHRRTWPSSPAPSRPMERSVSPSRSWHSPMSRPPRRPNSSSPHRTALPESWSASGCRTTRVSGDSI